MCMGVLKTFNAGKHFHFFQLNFIFSQELISRLGKAEVQARWFSDASGKLIEQVDELEAEVIRLKEKVCCVLRFFKIVFFFIFFKREQKLEKIF